MRPGRGFSARLAGLVVLGLAETAGAFVLFQNPTRHPNGALEMRAVIERAGSPLSPSGISWNAAFGEAAARWNAATPLVDVAVVQGSFEDPCDDGDGINGVGFGATVCGDGFGSQVLAIAIRTFTNGGLVTESNIVFKDDGSVAWDVFDEPLASRPDQRDFRRVAVHEIGHLLGLDHEDGVPAIMQTFVSDLFAPQLDDANGLAALYDLTCPTLQPGLAGTVMGSLGVADRDCLDTEIGLALPMLNFGPRVEFDSFVDLFAVTLLEAGPLSAELGGTTSFNPVVQILDATLTTQLTADWNTVGDTAQASASLAPGDYVVAVRSLFAGSGGGYALTLVPEPTAAPSALAAIAALTSLAVRRRVPRSAGYVLSHRRPEGRQGAAASSRARSSRASASPPARRPSALSLARRASAPLSLKSPRGGAPSGLSISSRPGLLKSNALSLLCSRSS